MVILKECKKQEWSKKCTLGKPLKEANGKTKDMLGG
jgi:hypothetical protein